MNREYQMTIDFQMGDYDAEQARDTMVDMVRRIMESFADGPVSVRFETGAEVQPTPSLAKRDVAVLATALRELMQAAPGHTAAWRNAVAALRIAGVTPS
jgi:hypothetical protein